jgi:hypothetical protein
MDCEQKRLLSELVGYIAIHSEQKRLYTEKRKLYSEQVRLFGEQVRLFDEQVRLPHRVEEAGPQAWRGYRAG